MGDSITPNVGLVKPEVGASDDLWGEKLNANFDKIDAVVGPSPVTKPYVDAQDSLRVLKSGDTMSGFLILVGPPTANLHAATKAYVDTKAVGDVTKAYVDAQDLLRILKSGDVMTGFLTLSGEPTAPLHAATKSYVDSHSGGGSGGVSISVTDIPPSSPTDGSLWWENDTGVLWIYYNDGSTQQWVQAAPGQGAAAVNLEGPSGYHYAARGIGTASAFEGFLQAGAGAVTRTWLDKGREQLSVRDFGAIGDGVANDTAAIQAAIVAASPKGIVFFPAGKYKTTAAINITTGIHLCGVGFGGFYASGSTLGSLILPTGAINTFNVVTDDAVTIEKLAFHDPANAATFIRIDTDHSTSVNSNYGSIIRDCQFSGGARGILGISILDFHFDNNGFYGQTLCSVEVNSLSLGNGDAVLTHCTFSGTPAGGHFVCGTMGGLRIVNNKFNSDGGFAIVLGQGGTVSGLWMAPTLIMNNSIEGFLYGIAFQRTGAGTMGVSNLMICANEFGMSIENGIGILSQVGGGNSQAWIKGGVISGNSFSTLVSNVTCIQLDAAEDINITGNQFFALGSVTATAIVLGSTTARITQSGNAAGLGFPAVTSAAPLDALAYNGLQVNGSMEVDQLFTGASITIPAGTISKNIIDNWSITKSGTNAFTVQQAPSVFPGYGKELKLTITTAQPVIGGDNIDIRQSIEGYRIARLGWGTAVAQPLTIGFWVKSSVAISINLIAYNSAFSVAANVGATIAAANVAQFVTATFPAQTTGAWLTNNGVGIVLILRIAGGAFNIAATNGNTFEITGLVLLPGILAPTPAQAPLTVRPFDQELVLCQRYYQQLLTGVGVPYSATAARLQIAHLQTMRATPTASVLGPVTLTDIYAANFTQSAANVTIFANFNDFGMYDFANFTGMTLGRTTFFLATSYPLMLDARL